MTASDLPMGTLHELAEAALEDGHPEKALLIARQLLHRDARDVVAWFLEGEALRDLADLAAAETSYHHVLDLVPEHAGAWCALASVLFDQRRFGEASAVVAQAIRAAPRAAAPYYTRAMLRERRGDLEGASRDYERARRFGDGFTLPERMTDDAILRLVLDITDTIDPLAAAWLRQAPTIIVDLPDDDTCDAYEPPASPGDVLAHLAAPLGAEPLPQIGLPPTVMLYRRNIERSVGDHDDLVAALQHGVIEQVQLWLSSHSTEA